MFQQLVTTNTESEPLCLSGRSEGNGHCVKMFFINLTVFPSVMAGALIYPNGSRYQAFIRDRPYFRGQYDLSYKSLWRRILFLYSLTAFILF